MYAAMPVYAVERELPKSNYKYQIMKKDITGAGLAYAA